LFVNTLARLFGTCIVASLQNINDRDNTQEPNCKLCPEYKKGVLLMISAHTVQYSLAYTVLLK